jgi:hypothetical protein
MKILKKIIAFGRVSNVEGITFEWLVTGFITNLRF